MPVSVPAVACQLVSGDEAGLHMLNLMFVFQALRLSVTSTLDNLIEITDMDSAYEFLTTNDMFAVLVYSNARTDLGVVHHLRRGNSDKTLAEIVAERNY